MKQTFSNTSHNNFKNYFKIKENPGEWDTFYIKKSKKYIKYISWIPGLKMIGIGNSISMNCSTENSDIDLFIVTSKEAMWLNRILITLIFSILGVRKTTKKHSGMFCLSFFSTINGLNFGTFALKNDIYLYFWIIYLKPILNYDNTYELFIKENQKWADFNDFLRPVSIETGLNGKKIGFISKRINHILKKIFISKTLNSYKSLGKPFGIIINDNILKFHNNDTRKKISKIIK